ncbi:MAG: HAD hydrolase-like protein [Thermodesulfobacteriota bacterium]
MKAGNRAGCRTILVQTGQGRESLIKIISGKTRIKPDWVCASLAAATILILYYFRSINDNANTLSSIESRKDMPRPNALSSYYLDASIISVKASS